LIKISSTRVKKKRKFRIVLDSAFPRIVFFPKLGKKAKLFHCVYDFQLSRQAEDKYIYQKAYENNCFVLTINFKDFKKLVRKDGPGILGIESQMTTVKIDEVVTKFVSGKDPDDFLGKAVKVPMKDT
jgi:hypothetical protein